MTVFLLPGIVRVQPELPVEMKATVGGETVQVAIEWPLLRRWLGDRAGDPDAVRSAIQQRRTTIERAIAARVFAHGVPISRELSLGPADLGR